MSTTQEQAEAYAKEYALSNLHPCEYSFCDKFYVAGYLAAAEPRDEDNERLRAALSFISTVCATEEQYRMFAKQALGESE